SGVVSQDNSLVGSDPKDYVGLSESNFPGSTPLSNGNYVVQSPWWDGRRGAVTWGSGTAGVRGTVSAANSLVGGSAGDEVGSGRQRPAGRAGRPRRPGRRPPGQRQLRGPQPVLEQPARRPHLARRQRPDRRRRLGGQQPGRRRRAYHAVERRQLRGQQPLELRP